MAAGSLLCAMSHANSSFWGVFGVPPVVALLHICTMLVANSSLDSSVGAPFAAALLHLCTMADTNSFFWGVIGAPTVAASLYHCAMSHANPSASGLVLHPSKEQTCLYFFAVLALLYLLLSFFKTAFGSLVSFANVGPSGFFSWPGTRGLLVLPTPMAQALLTSSPWSLGQNDCVQCLCE